MCSNWIWTVTHPTCWYEPWKFARDTRHEINNLRYHCFCPPSPQSAGDLLTCNLLIRTMEARRWLSKHIESNLLLQLFRHLMWYLLLCLPAFVLRWNTWRHVLSYCHSSAWKISTIKSKQSGSQLLGAARLFAQTMLWKHLQAPLIRFETPKEHISQHFLGLLFLMPNKMHCKLNKQLWGRFGDIYSSHCTLSTYLHSLSVFTVYSNHL